MRAPLPFFHTLPCLAEIRTTQIDELDQLTLPLAPAAVTSARGLCCPRVLLTPLARVRDTGTKTPKVITGCMITYVVSYAYGTQYK